MSLSKHEEPKRKCYITDSFKKKNACHFCGKKNYDSSMIKASTDDNKRVSFMVWRCKNCSTYYVRHSSYILCTDEWLVLNPEDIQDRKKPNVLISTTKMRKITVIPKHGYNINKKDFVVRQTIFKCRYNDHTLNNIEAVIDIKDRNGNIIRRIIPAAHCQICNTFFIMESTYQDLRREGIPICRISDEKSYLSNAFLANGAQLSSESILRTYGYNVSSKEGLSDVERHIILSSLVDNNVLTKNEIIGYLDFFINQRKTQNRYKNAIEKWENDREYITDYKKGQYQQFAVGSISRRKSTRSQ